MKMESGVAQEEAVDSMVKVLKDGGLICLPCNGTYRIFADLENLEAVMHLFQSKRRVHKAPSLVFIDSAAKLARVTEENGAETTALMNAFWPGPLTILFEATNQLPRKVIKELTRANGKLGVRVPEDPLARKVVKKFGGAVLVSSANKGRKAGESSPAQVRQSFLGRVDYFLDAGDLQSEPSSTVIDLSKGDVEIVREGAVAEEEIRNVLEALDQ